LQLEGEVDPARMRRALEAVLRRHPALRAAFRDEGIGLPMQVIPANAPAPWREEDLSGLDPNSEAARSAAELAADREARFDLAAPPLLRCTWLRLGALSHRFILNSHHLLMDGWSMSVFLGELFAIYRAGGEDSLPSTGRQWRSYVEWLSRYDQATA